MTRFFSRALRGPLVAALLAVGLASPAFAIDLDAARAQGLVGERADGYVAAVNPNPSGEVAALVTQVNAARRVHYEGVAAKQPGATVAAVGALAHQKLVSERLPSGTYIQGADGSWRRKP